MAVGRAGAVRNAPNQCITWVRIAHLVHPGRTNCGTHLA
jgi:hypothetical protein